MKITDEKKQDKTNIANLLHAALSEKKQKLKLIQQSDAGRNNTELFIRSK